MITNIRLQRATLKSAGYDLPAPHDVHVPKRGRVLVDTGITYEELDEGLLLEIHSKSGLAIKHGITAFLGVCDGDYPKNIGVLLTNSSDSDYIIPKGKAIAQAVLKRYETFKNEIPPDSIRTGGFGSTNK